MSEWDSSCTRYAALRPIEDFVHRLPLGTQYQVLARKPR